MKILRLSLLVMGIATNAVGQGQLDFDNLDNSNPSFTATSSGLFWLSTGGAPALINQDFNAALYGGTNSSNLPLLKTVLLGNGTGIGDNSSPGYFREPSGDSYTIPGAIDSAFFRVEAWLGNYNSYAAAVAGGAPAAQSLIFVNPVDIAPGPPSDLTGMPAMVLGVPEPSTLALFGLGWLVLLRRAITQPDISTPRPPCKQRSIQTRIEIEKFS